MKKIALLLIPLWFAILMPWGVFTDPDAFYHAHITARILEYGPLTTFPWLNLTILGTQFADQHLLFHLLTLPALAIMQTVAPNTFTAFWAAQMMAVLFASITTYTLWRMLRRINPQHATLLTICTLLVPGFSVRMLLGKASPLTVALFIVTAWALATHGRFRRLILFACGTLFALTHGGWIILILTALGILATDIALRRFGESNSWRTAITQSPWQPALALLGGIALGLLLHPNRSALFHYLTTQLITAAVAPPAGLLQGMEWRSASLAALIASLATLLIPLILAIAGLINAPHVTRTRLRTTILLFMPVALTLALTVNSRKFIEYLAPALALFVAAVWTLIDKRVFIQTLHAHILAPLARALPVLLGLTTALLVAHQSWSAYASLRAKHARPFNAYRTTLAAISERAAPGDRVFHTNWDEFPTLFAANDALAYISGLDPAFLYDADPALAADIQELTLGHTTATAWELITERTQSRFVFTTHTRHPIFDQFLAQDPRFVEIARDQTTAAYELAQ